MISGSDESRNITDFIYQLCSKILHVFVYVKPSAWDTSQRLTNWAHFLSLHSSSIGRSFLRVCNIAVCDFHVFHLTLQIETDFIFFVIYKEITHLISQARNKWLESIQPGPGEAPKIILYLMDCPDCVCRWGRCGKESGICEIKFSWAQMLWMSQRAGWVPWCLLWFLGVHLLGARFGCPSSWADPLGFLVNAPPSLCMLYELPLCVNYA